jgi:succinate-semialdehyde dehydrogenase/glutarate-semialdehyde dehydrogenase
MIPSKCVCAFPSSFPYSLFYDFLDCSLGLSAYFCTKDLAKAWYVAEQLEAGIIGVNEAAVSTAHMPFGGWKESGIGREGGLQGIAEYLEEKYICMGLGKSSF